MFRDVFLIAELLDSKAESDDVGWERSWLGCSVRSSGLSGLWSFTWHTFSRRVQREC